jgi:hypothetical protein
LKVSHGIEMSYLSRVMRVKYHLIATEEEVSPTATMVSEEEYFSEQ